MGVKSFGAWLVVAVLAAVVAMAPASQAASDASTSTYIVQMVQAPAASYEGGVAGHPATKPLRGRKLDKQSTQGPRLCGLPRPAAFRGAGRGRRRREALRLHHRLQRLRGEADRRASEGTGEGAGRPVGRGRRHLRGRHGNDAALPGPRGSARALEAARRRHRQVRRRRGHDHRCHRLGHHAGERRASPTARSNRTSSVRSSTGLSTLASRLTAGRVLARRARNGSRPTATTS